MKTVVALITAIALSIGVVFADAGDKVKGKYEEPPMETGGVGSFAWVPAPEPDWLHLSPPPVGAFTTLTGFYDFQSNGGRCAHIAVDPTNGAIHVVYMLSDDSTAANLSNSRGTGYAYSTNGGATWNNFSQVRVPPRRSGFPALDVGRSGVIAGAPIVVNHNDPSPPSIANNFSFAYIDAPPGFGVFGELPLPVPIAGTLQPIWPQVAGTANGSVVMAATPNITGGGPDAFLARTSDYSLWSGWNRFPLTNPSQTGGRNPVASNGTGRVGILLNTSNQASPNRGNHWLESTNNGQTWPTSATTIYPDIRIEVAETLASYAHSDVVYNGDNPLMVFSEYNAEVAATSKPRISFWSQSTGFRTAVAWDSTRFRVETTTPTQRFHPYGVGWPVIGLSGSTIVVAFQAFQADTGSFAYQYSDIWFTKSTNGGLSWATPENLTNSPTLDEKYPSISKWNAPGEANIVWSQKSKPGLYAFPGAADTVRTFQVFLRKSITTDVKEAGEIANRFTLSQNFPNPFNPSTQIDYTVTQASNVRIVVYNMLGEEITTLLNRDLQPGTYQITFDGAQLATGIYYYKMTAGSFTETKKMMLVK